MYKAHRCLPTLLLSSFGLACASGDTSSSRGEDASSAESEGLTSTTGGEPDNQASATGQPAECAPLAPQIETILKSNCANCHGPNSAGQGGMNYITSLVSLVAKRKVIPDDPEGSPLYVRMNSGQMPPAGVQPRPSPAEIEVVRQWIAAGACVTAAPADCADNSVVSRDEMIGAMRNDIQKLDLSDRVFIRYLTLTHLHNAGVCDGELEPYRQAISKLLNSLSLKPLIKPPTPIDPERTIFRLDVRHYGWDEVSQKIGEDIWDASAAANPYALLFQDGAIEDLKNSSGTDFPFQPADSFLHIVTRAPLYNKFLQLPDTIGKLEQELGVDVAADLAKLELVRAGFKDSGVSEFNRVIERHLLPTSGTRYYYRSYDFNSSAGAASIFTNPLQIEDFAAGGEYIFSLPNGMQAYLISNAAGVVINEAPVQIVSDPKQRDRTVHNAISCMSCHDRGILPKADEVWPFVEANFNLFSVEDRKKVEAIYHPDFGNLQVSDADAFADAMSKAGVAVDAPEPIVLTYLSFEADLDLRRVAAEIDIDPEILRKNLALLSKLDKSLLALYDGGVVNRDTFSLVFKDIMCELQPGLDVTPFCVDPE